MVASIVSGCGADPAVSLTHWSLVDYEGREHGAIALPAHFANALPPREGTYELRCQVALPPAFRKRALSLTIPYFAAITTLRVDGHDVVASRLGASETYRSDSHHWEIPSEITDTDTLDLVLAVRHTWTQSAWLDTVPRLSATPNGDARFLLIHTSNVASAWISATSIILIALVYALISWLAEQEVAYAWFAVAALSALPFATYPAGLFQSLLGRYEIPAAALGIAASAVASVRFAHARLALKAPSSLWLWSVMGLAVLCVFAGGPFEATRIVVPVTFVIVAANAVFFVVVALRMYARRPPPLNAFTMTLGWPIALCFASPDICAWLGFGELLQGLRIGPAASAGIVLAQLVALGRDHVLSLRRADTLNEELSVRVALLEASHREIGLLNGELRHQVAVRSEQLAELLAQQSEETKEASLVPGDVVGGRYRVEDKLGSGGAGHVFKVSRVTDGKQFALKTMRRPHDRVELARFAREAVVAAQVRHPNVVSLVDLDVEHAGFLYLVMDLVPGPSLRDERHRFGETSWAIPILRQVASGLTAIHAVGIVHRDLKPGNVLLVPGREGDGPRARIADFGIASAVRRPIQDTDVADPLASEYPTRSVVAPAMPSLPSLTDARFALGTPMYMAPETFSGEGRLEVSADVFSFGVMAFEMLAGVRPYGDSLSASAGLVYGRLRPTLGERDPSLPKSLVALVERCLARDPEERPTAAEVAAALRD